MSPLARRALPLAALLALLVAPPALAGKGFSLGVTPGEVTSSSAILWAHAKKSGEYRVRVAENKRLRHPVVERLVRAKKRHDNTVQAALEKLDPGTRYFFRFFGAHGHGRRSDMGVFRTAPKPKRNATVEFAWSGDTDFTAAPGQSEPYWNDGEIFRRMRAERNDFNIHFGDTIYSDSEVPGALEPIALTVKQKWAKYRTNLANANLQALRRSAGFYSHWDDHEFINDFSPAESTFSNDVNINGRTLYKRGVRAFTDYAPVEYSRSNGLYRTVRWGRNLELFFLDQRSFRSAKADEGGVCNNPQTGQPDLAPTAPRSTRLVFSAVVPSLAEPVSQACLDAINSPDRAYLGKRQLNRFVRAVESSNARFKVVMNELPILQYYVLPYDRWEGYAAERTQILQDLRNVKNVVFLTTDVHATLANNARFQTLEQGGPKDSSIFDITVGPAATANFGIEIDDTTGRPGNGTLVDSAFLEQEPPNGVGFDCSIVDQFSYGEVRVTRNRLTVTPKGIDGQPQQNGNKPCGPFVFQHQS